MPNAVLIDLPEIDTRPDSPPNPLADEERAFARMLPELLTTHAGKVCRGAGWQSDRGGDGLV